MKVYLHAFNWFFDCLLERIEKKRGDMRDKLSFVVDTVDLEDEKIDLIEIGRSSELHIYFL